jgi:probable rRNA maturation factor
MDGDHSDFRGDLLGDVVIGLETAARQAESGARDLDAEIARLLIHGALHLLGWDHVDASEARRMRAEERRILRAIGA